jgi:hypothetical protein
MKGIVMSNEESLVPLITDKEIADLVGLSESWVRQQRSNRRRGKQHVLTVDPLLVNDSPRYKRADIEVWFGQLTGESAASKEVAQ